MTKKKKQPSEPAIELVGLEDTLRRATSVPYRGMAEELKPPHVQKRNRTALRDVKALGEHLASLAPVLDEEVLEQVHALLRAGLARADQRAAAKQARDAAEGLATPPVKQPAKRPAKKDAPPRKT